MVFPAKALSLLSVSCLKMEIRRFMRSVKAIEHIWQAFHLEGWRWAGKGVGLLLWDPMWSTMLPMVSESIFRAVSGNTPTIRETLLGWQGHLWGILGRKFTCLEHRSRYIVGVDLWKLWLVAGKSGKWKWPYPGERWSMSDWEELLSWGREKSLMGCSEAWVVLGEAKNESMITSKGSTWVSGGNDGATVRQRMLQVMFPLLSFELVCSPSPRLQLLSVDFQMLRPHDVPSLTWGRDDSPNPSPCLGPSQHRGQAEDKSLSISPSLLLYYPRVKNWLKGTPSAGGKGPTKIHQENPTNSGVDSGADQFSVSSWWVSGVEKLRGLSACVCISDHFLFLLEEHFPWPQAVLLHCSDRYV